MARLDKEKLKKKYGKDKSFRDLLFDIVSTNKHKMTQSIMEIQESQYTRSFNAIPKNKKAGKRLVIPNISEVMPSDSSISSYALERSDKFAKEVRARVSDAMRETMSTFTAETGKSNIVISTGKTAGQIDPLLIEKFKSKLNTSLAGYITELDPMTGRPVNINQIATTEMRATINMAKEEYKDNLMGLNENLRAKKTWNHHPSLSEVPRKGHSQQNGKTIDDQGLFQVNSYIIKDGKHVKTGYDFMTRPHDPLAPANQVMNCHCDITFKLTLLGKK